MTDDQPHDQDELSELLTVELHRRADGMHGSLGFDEVRGQARSIRRRRAAAGLVGVAAAVAIIVPTALVASRSDRSQEPLPAAQSSTVSASQTSAPSETVDPNPHRLDVSDLPTGAPPAILLVSDALTAGLFQLAQVGDATIRVSDNGVVVTEADGSTDGPFGSDSGVVRNEQGTVAAWVTANGEVMAWQDGQSEPLVLATVDLAGPRVAAVTGFDCRPGGRCSVWLSGSDPTSYELVSVQVDQDGTTSPVDSGPGVGLLIVRDVTEGGTMLGTTRLTIDGSCSALVDGPGSPEALRFTTCRHQLDAFSASGRYVLASEPYHSGIGSGVIAFYDAETGEPTAFRIADQQGLAYYTSATWEDDTHALFTAYQDGRWSVVRLSVDGSMEYAVAPVAGDGTAGPFVLETR